jgi:hypothetical protein
MAAYGDEYTTSIVPVFTKAADVAPVCGILNEPSVEKDQKASPIGHSSAVRMPSIFK